MDFVSLSEGLARLPPLQLVAGATVLLLATALILRLFTNTFTFKHPPVMEGIPFVGGLIKFSKVSARWSGIARAACRNTDGQVWVETPL